MTPLKGLILMHIQSIVFYLPMSIYIYVFLLQISIAVFFLLQVSIAIRDSCPVSPSTVEIVDNCPDSEKKWRLAAARKNCSAHASQCDKPESLMYHCVINAFVNETLEVCAYRRNIVFGRI